MAAGKKKVSRAFRSKLRRDYVLPKMSEGLRYLTVQGTLLDRVRSVVTLPLKIDRSQMGEHLPSLFNLLERMPNANPYLAFCLNQSASNLSYRGVSRLGTQKHKRTCRCSRTLIDWSTFASQEQLKETFSKSGPSTDNLLEWDAEIVIHLLFQKWHDLVVPKGPKSKGYGRFEDLQDLDNAITTYFAYARLVARHFSCFATSTGFVGAAPVGIERGDHIVLLQVDGRDMAAAILRPRQGHNFTFYGLAMYRASWLTSWRSCAACAKL